MATKRKTPLKSEIEAENKELRIRLAKMEEKLANYSGNEKNEIDWNNYDVQLMQLMRGRTDVSFGSGDRAVNVGQFDGMFDTMTISFSDLRRVINVTPFKKYFRNLGIIILDDAVIKKLNYQSYYEKHGIYSKEQFESLFDLDIEKFKEKISKFSLELQNAVVYQCLVGIIKDDMRFASSAIKDAIKNTFNIEEDLSAIAERIKIELQNN